MTQSSYNTYLEPEDEAFRLINAPIAPAPDHLPESMVDSVRLLPTDKRLILFTRHSLRERSDGNGFASSQLPLTPKGKILAQSWGRWLGNNLPYSMDVDSISSPIQRCVDTASLMQQGAGIRREVAHQSLLVEPGSLVIDSDIASPLFKEIGALNFINRFLIGDLPGTKNAHQGGLDMLSLFFHHQPKQGHLLLAVSHDTLLSAFLSVMMQVKEIGWNDWPKMMEGVFLWFDEVDSENQQGIGKPLSEAKVYFIWRGKIYQRSIQELISAYIQTEFYAEQFPFI